MTPKSPFYVVQHLISPLACEGIIDRLDVTIPDVDTEGYPLVSYRHNKTCEKIVFEQIEPLIPKFEEYYQFEYKGTERPTFEWYVEGTEDKFRCGNSEYLRGKWVRTRSRDLTGLIFLKDYQDKVPFDEDFEVMGGKVEFPQHDFGFNPERGTMVVFPSGPHFLHRIAPIEAGELFVVRFHIAAQTPYLYQPVDFPGDYTTWFKGLT